MWHRKQLSIFINIKFQLGDAIMICSINNKNAMILIVFRRYHYVIFQYTIIETRGKGKG